jgi:hypothetical protein
MAKQTINIGASPNDGTGTPLRTSFDYCNQNFTELYTATGPSGNNIVVPGSATITGALTVGTATALATGSGRGNVTVNGSTDAILAFGIGGVNSGFILEDAGGMTLLSTGATYIRAYTNGVERYRIASDGVATWSNVGGVAGTAMTLNATGLGVGVSPTNNLHVKGASGTTAIKIEAVTDGPLGFIGSASGMISGSPANNLAIRAENGLYLSGGGNATQFILNSSGNVGVGVTPSSWWTGFKAIELTNGVALLGQTNVPFAHFSTNAYAGVPDWLYKVSSNFALRYAQDGTTGNHQWFNAVSGTAGNPINWMPRMTLDSSGNLLVGKTAVGDSNIGVQLMPTAGLSMSLSSQINAQTTCAVYSTTAGQYRFYVGMGGTVYATTTAISAISDARLKENVQDIDVGLAAILSLKPRKFDWKAGKGKDIKGDRGFIAQEFETVFPNLIDEWKDPAPEGEAPYKSVRQDLIPVLVKAIQELAAEVNALKKA